MDQGMNKMFFALLRSAICGTRLEKEAIEQLTFDEIGAMVKLATKHDLAHLFVCGMKLNGLISKENEELEEHIYKAVMRYEQLAYEYERLSDVLERAGIAFIPLKGALLRQYYPEPWMRTSCDIDILVHRESMGDAISKLSEELGYKEVLSTTHDVSLFSESGAHIELHFDLMEETCANNAMSILGGVWNDVSLCEGWSYRYEMSDAFFYFFHIAHMAKHMETGGCGVRPLIDTWILDHIDGADKAARNELLLRGGLLKFSESAGELSEVWFGGREHSELTLQMEEFIFTGGTYGSSFNRVAIQQKKNGGRIGYVLSRMFIPFSKLKRYYPVLEKHPWLMPFMQVRRWCMLFTPRIAKMAKSELAANEAVDKEKAREANSLLKNIGLE